jgi:hypothetical protein
MYYEWVSYSLVGHNYLFVKGMKQQDEQECDVWEFIYCLSDSHDVDLHQMWQAEEEKEWREKNRRKCEWFSGVDTRLLPDSTTMDYD